ncbi:EamA family transporter [Salinarimonas rosea]|uniref:EamA family transporter n=1 Tax=Salinarimonas rosea TaxID=552063 RepID=UPI0004165E32|nr:DMT family transporter [Salinarimonas rosea]
MDPLVLAAILFAAFLHAAWNALVKANVDRFTMMLMIAVVQTAIACTIVPFVPLPAAPAWPWLLLTAIPHTTYKVFLARAYDTGELARIYPIMRGLTLALVTGASIGLLGESVPLLGLVGVAVIGAGVVILSAPGGGALAGARAATLAITLGAAASSAAYTVIDGIGVRLAGEVAAFAAWLFVLDGLGMILFAAATRGRPAFDAMAPHWRAGLLAGSIAFGCYWIALWALAHAPIALVAALRETSILFALALARLRLAERLDRAKLGGAGAVLAGIVLILIE